MNMDTGLIQHEPSCNSSNPIPEAIDNNPSFFEKLHERATAFQFPQFEFDRFCHFGEVIDGVAEELEAEDFPKRGREFMAEHAEILQSKSEVVQQRVKDGWKLHIATLHMIPSTFAERWKEAANIYHRSKKYEDETSSELVLR